MITELKTKASTACDITVRRIARVRTLTSVAPKVAETETAR